MKNTNFSKIDTAILVAILIISNTIFLFIIKDLSHNSPAPNNIDAPATGTTPQIVNRDILDIGAASTPNSNEDEIRAVSKGFLDAYYYTDTAVSPEEYPHKFDDYITDTGNTNMDQWFGKPEKIEDSIRILAEVDQADIYVFTKPDGENATVLCVVYLEQTLEPEDGNTNVTYDPRMIKLHLKNTPEYGWRVNYISFKASLYGVHFDVDELIE